MLERYGRNGGPVHREGCGVPQNGTPSDTVHLHRRLPPRVTVHPPSTASTGSCSSTVDLLQPPPATVYPRGSCSSSLHHSFTGYCSANPLHGVLFNHPSMGYCSSNPPPASIQPALHGDLFIHPQLARSGSCSSSGNSLYYHGVLFIQPPPGTVHANPPTKLTVHQEAAGLTDFS